MLEFLVPIIAFSGIFIGLLLKKIAKEEIKFGKFGGKYFIWMKRIILLLLIIMLLYFSDNYLFIIAGIIIGLILGVFLSEYLFLGMISVIGFLQSKDILLIISSLIFLYGMPYGSILRKIKLRQLISVTLSFFIPFLLLIVNLDLNLLIGISSGGLFHYIIKK